MAWSGDDEHVGTDAEVALAVGKASATWTPPVDRPGEYWCSASVTEPAVVSSASALLLAL